METVRSRHAGVGFKTVGDMPPKVLIVVEASGGGSGRHVVELAHGLLARGCDVHLIYSELRADRAFREGIQGMPELRVHQIAMRREPHASDVRCLWELRRYLRQFGPFDVVHAHSSKAGALARVAAAGISAAKIYTPHAMRTMDPTLNPLLRGLYRMIEVILARSVCDATIAVSEFERKHIVEQGVPADQLHVVINGIPPAAAPDYRAVRESLGIAVDDVCVGFIGRLVPQKAPERFVTALASVAQTHPQVRGLVVGSGPLEEAVRMRAEACGIADRMIWESERPGPTVMPAFDILMMPSLYEGMPYVLLEALASGVPVVATDVGGVGEAIEDRVTGFVVPQCDADALVQRLAQLVADRTLRASMAEASLRKSSELSVDRMVEQTLQVYRTALRGRLPLNRPLPVGLDPKRAG